MQRKQNQTFEEGELDIFVRQLSPEELFIIGFLKGFDRKVTAEWQERGLWDND